MSKTKTKKAKMLEPTPEKPPGKAGDLVLSKSLDEKRSSNCVTCNNERVSEFMDELLTDMLADPKKYRRVTMATIYRTIVDNCGYEYPLFTFRRCLANDEPRWLQWLEIKKGLPQ